MLLIGDPRALPRELRERRRADASTSTAPQTVASIDRIKKIAKNLKATVIIQHDPRDIEQAAGFPGGGEIVLLPTGAMPPVPAARPAPHSARLALGPTKAKSGRASPSLRSCR